MFTTQKLFVGTIKNALKFYPPEKVENRFFSFDFFPPSFTIRTTGGAPEQKKTGKTKDGTFRHSFAFCTSFKTSHVFVFF
jgi:hypothetical protein